jgi:hypothetical protein
VFQQPTEAEAAIPLRQTSFWMQQPFFGEAIFLVWKKTGANFLEQMHLCVTSGRAPA